MSDKVKWACPKCEATPEGCKSAKKKVVPLHRGVGCLGFICECADETDASHGESTDDPCPQAVCYHCGWAGTFPVPPFKLKGWAKKAWDAGWRPPAGWQP